MTKPELLKRWHGAQGWNLIECAVDLRVGGDWRIVSQGPGGMMMLEIRDLVAASPMESGINQSYARLDDVPASMSKAG